MDERKLLGLKIVLIITDKVKANWEKIKIAQDRQKSYVDNRRKDLEFEVGDMVFLKVIPWKRVIQFGRRGKLRPRYIRSYEIIEKIGPVVCRLVLPKNCHKFIMGFMFLCSEHTFLILHIY